MAAYRTKQRQALLAYLAGHPDESLTAAQIAAALEADGVSLSAVYRNLAALEEEGKIRRVAKGPAREACYQYTDAAACRAQLHLLCNHCGRTIHMDPEDASRLAQSLLKNEHFTIDTAGTVLYGECERCRIAESVRGKKA